MPKKESKHTFEQSLHRLEKIVSELEQGEISLEDSLSIYEEGIQLSMECMETLSKAEIRIKRLTKDLNGRFRLTDINENE